MRVLLLLTSRLVLALGLASLSVCLVASARAQSGDSPPADSDSYFELELEDLLDIKVTLPSRNEESAFVASSAIYVITREDIHRSGMRRLPELLRMVPGMQVGKIDANKWSINSRFQSFRFSGTMLVLMDGRTIYDPLTAGVYWENQDVMLEDVERIEIIRGPGGSLWGANAVTGIINIITRKSSETDGGLVYLGGGMGEMQVDGGLRYGTKLGSESYLRLYAKGWQTDTGVYAPAEESTNRGFFPVGDDANDSGKLAQAGARADWSWSSRETTTLQGDYYKGEIDDVRVVGADPQTNDPGEALPNTTDVEGANVLARWKRDAESGSSIEIQGFLDYVERKDSIFAYERKTIDLDGQYSFEAPRQQIVGGLGYRYNTDQTQRLGNGVFGLDPADRVYRIYSAFLHDRIALTKRRLFFVIGSKFEHNDFTGFEYEPTARLLWTPNTNNTGWIAMSRSVRTPSRVGSDGSLYFGGPPIPIGDPAAESIVFLTPELGYRTRIGGKALVDAAVYYQDVDTKNSQELSGPFDSFGFELMGRYEARSNWRMELSWTFNETWREATETSNRGMFPMANNRAHFRSYWDPSASFGADVLAYYVEKVDARSRNIVIPAYLRLDIRLEWRPDEDWEISLTGTNLLDEAHVEDVEPTRVNTAVQRAFLLRGELRF